jgi:hypothetical protein
LVQNETNMIAKNIEQIKQEDLQTLIDNSVLERKTMDYKRLLPRKTDSSKKEFLADVSSFANASGGDLIFGIIQDDETGFPRELAGLDIKNVDQEILRLDSMIRDGVDPRIPSVKIQPIGLSNSKTVLIIRVHKSWLSPHRVTFGGHDKFYSRSSNGKYPMDVTELRVAFDLAGRNIERIRGFRESRISSIFANEMPMPFCESAKMVLHLIPVIAFDPAQRYNVQDIALHHGKLKPMVCSGWNYRYNLDGFLTYAQDKEGKTCSYVQVFRNGIIEGVEGRLLAPWTEELSIPSIAYEEELIKSIPDYLSVLKALNIGFPVFIFLTLIGVKGYSMAVDSWFRERHKIDKEVLFLPEVMIEKHEVKMEDVLRPIFDAVWNACGFPKSLNYDDNGKRRPRR